jgi:hypothetical protein
LQKVTDVSEILAASIIRAMIEATNISETSVNVYQATRRNNPEYSQLYTWRCEKPEILRIA